MYTRKLLCLLVIVACATAASISGLASLDANAFEAQGRIVFPIIPGFNAPLSRIISGNNSEDVETFSNPDASANNSGPSPFLFFKPFNPFAFFLSNLSNVIPTPNVTAILSRYPNLDNVTSVIVPPIAPLPPVHKHFIPGLSGPLYQARQRLAQALNTAGDVATGIRNAIEQAFLSGDPVGGINALIQTILTVYGAAIRNCPLMIGGARLAAEASQLVAEVVRAISNVIIQ